MQTGFKAVLGPLLLAALACSDRESHGYPSGHTPTTAGDPGGDPTPADGGDAAGDGLGDPGGDPAGDPVAGDPAGDPVAGDPAGDPAAGDPAGDPAAGDPAGDPGDPAGDASGDAGAASCGEVGLCFRLTWDSSDGDLDLHLSKDDAAWCSYQSCYFGNCKASSAYRVDWDGAPDSTAGDPTLFEDGWGDGPELILIPEPVNGTYVVGVYYQPSGASPVGVTVEIVADGAILGTFAGTVAPDGFIEAAAVVVDGTVQSPTGLTRVCTAGTWSCNDPVGTCP